MRVTARNEIWVYCFPIYGIQLLLVDVTDGNSSICFVSFLSAATSSISMTTNEIKMQATTFVIALGLHSVKMS
jgi:hypothetical protein